MYKQLSAYPSKVSVVVTGPMTNVALLLRVYPKVKANIEKIVLMGGGVKDANVTPHAEFNLWCDPDAAEVVFNSGIPVYMMPLDVTHKALFLDDTKQKLIDMKSRFIDACVEMLEFYKKAYKETQNFDNCPIHDPTAVAYCIAPEIFETIHCHVDVHTDEEKKGKTVCDIEGKSEKKPNVYVALKMDVSKFWELMVSAMELAAKNSRIEN